MERKNLVVMYQDPNNRYRNDRSCSSTDAFGTKKSVRLRKKSDKNHFEFIHPEQFHYIKYFLISNLKNEKKNLYSWIVQEFVCNKNCTIWSFENQFMSWMMQISLKPFLVFMHVSKSQLYFFNLNSNLSLFYFKDCSDLDVWINCFSFSQRR